MANSHRDGRSPYHFRDLPGRNVPQFNGLPAARGPPRMSTPLYPAHMPRLQGPYPPPHPNLNWDHNQSHYQGYWENSHHDESYPMYRPPRPNFAGGGYDMNVGAIPKTNPNFMRDRTMNLGPNGQNRVSFQEWEHQRQQEYSNRVTTNDLPSHVEESQQVDSLGTTVASSVMDGTTAPTYTSADIPVDDDTSATTVDASSVIDGASGASHPPSPIASSPKSDRSTKVSFLSDFAKSLQQNKQLYGLSPEQVFAAQKAQTEMLNELTREGQMSISDSQVLGGLGLNDQLHNQLKDLGINSKTDHFSPQNYFINPTEAMFKEQIGNKRQSDGLGISDGQIDIDRIETISTGLDTRNKSP